MQTGKNEEIREIDLALGLKFLQSVGPHRPSIHQSVPDGIDDIIMGFSPAQLLEITERIDTVFL